MCRVGEFQPRRRLLPEWDPSPLVEALQLLTATQCEPGVARFGFGSARRLEVAIDLDPLALAPDVRDWLMGPNT